MRHPKVLLACLAYERAERRDGPADYRQRRADDAKGTDPRFADRGDGLLVETHEVPVGGGASIEVTVYRPAGDEPLPMHLHLHGGAFCYGGTRNIDGLLREFARAGLVVASADYRLAPEHPWPVPVEDTYAALQWAAANAERLGARPDGISIGGSSAGGTIAAAVAMIARDRGGPALAGQLLEIPATDLTLGTGRSMERYARGYLGSKQHLAECYDMYVPDPADRRDPYVSPIFAPDLAGLPPTLVVTAEYDALRDEGEEYGRLLRAAGVPVEAVRARGQVHSSTHSQLPAAVRSRAAMTTWLSRVHVLTVAR